MPPVWNAAEAVDTYSHQQPYWSERSSPNRGFSVHSFLLNSLDGATRYEVIIQSKNKFGWSEQTRPFIFTTRFQGEEFMTFLIFSYWKKASISDYSPRDMASFSHRDGLVSSTNNARNINDYMIVCLMIMKLLTISN